jgi:hypothetical protein
LSRINLMPKLHKIYRDWYCSYAVVALFVMQVISTVVLFETASFFKEIPLLRSLLDTGTRSSILVESLIRNELAGQPVVVEANSEIPLRDSPPKPNGFLPLQKGAQIGEIPANSEWIVVDTVRMKKITGDDTWIRIAKKDDAEKHLSSAKMNVDQLRSQIDKLNSDHNNKKIQNGWAYLGSNFTPDK